MRNVFGKWVNSDLQRDGIMLVFVYFRNSLSVERFRLFCSDNVTYNDSLIVPSN